MKLWNVKKDLAFSTSKNLLSMSNFSAKENTNIDCKSENEIIIQKSIDSLFNIQKYHSNKIIMTHININSFRKKFDMLTNSVTQYVDILMISETKLAGKFLYTLYHLENFPNPYRLDRNSYVGGIFV